MNLLTRRSLLRSSLAAPALLLPRRSLARDPIVHSGGTQVIAPASGGGGGSWILATGFWNDAGLWVDSAIWID